MKLLTLLVFNLTVILLWSVAAVAHAGIGIAVGPHMGMSNPLTPHVGRVYYKSSGGGPVGDEQAIQANIDAALGITEAPKRDYAKLRKLRCDQEHMAYFMRHGVTTPNPLKGYRGCQKYAMDEAYWRHRRDGVPNLPSGPIAAIQAQIGQAVRSGLQIL